MKAKRSNTMSTIGRVADMDVDLLVKQFKQSLEEDQDGEEAQANEQDEAGNFVPRVPPALPFVDWPSFNFFIGLVIAANAVTIGLEEAARSEGNGNSALWYLLEVLFCFIFFAELGFRLYFHRLNFFGTLGQTAGEAVARVTQRRTSTCLSFVRLRTWNILDFIIVVTAVIDTFVLIPIGMGGTARVAALMRFVRLVRLIRLVRLFKIFKELYLVANGLLNSLKTLAWVCGLLVVLIEVGAIVTTRAIGHNDELYDPYFRSSGGWDHEIYFKTVGRSMFTLCQVVTFDSWSDDIVRHVGSQQPGMVAFFIGFMGITSFGLLNVIVGVVIETTLRTSQENAAKMKGIKERDRQMVFQQLRDIFVAADTDGSGTLSLDEVKEAVNNKPEVYNKLKKIDFPVDDPEQLFTLLDYDNSGELSIEEFITGCTRMKGRAKSKDLLDAQVTIDTMRRHFDQFEFELSKFHGKLALLHETARSLVGQGEHVFLSSKEYHRRHPDQPGHSGTEETPTPQVPEDHLMQAPWNKRSAQGGTNSATPTNLGQLRALANGQPPPPAPPSVSGSPPSSRLMFDNGVRTIKDANMIADGSGSTPTRAILNGPGAQGNDALALTQMPGAIPR